MHISQRCRKNDTKNAKPEPKTKAQYFCKYKTRYARSDNSEACNEPEYRMDVDFIADEVKVPW